MATKIGVYFDQSAIGGGLDVEELVSGVENKWGDLCLVVKSFPIMATEAARANNQRFVPVVRPCGRVHP